MRRLARILAWLGLAASLAAVAVGLVYYGNLMRPFWKGTAARYWSGVAGVPVAEGEERYGQPPPLVDFPHRYFYESHQQGQIPLHGTHYREVPEAEVLAAFPEVLERLIADPTELHPDQVRALVGDNAVSKDEGLKRLAFDRAAIGHSLERMREFLRASYKVRLARGLAEFGPDMATWQKDEADLLSGWVARSDHYGANVVFEGVFLGGLVTFFWLPVLSARAGRWMAVLWGSLPVLLFAPYWLGYCRAALIWPDAKFWGGALYPCVLDWLGPLADLAKLAENVEIEIYRTVRGLLVFLDLGSVVGSSRAYSYGSCLFALFEKAAQALTELDRAIVQLFPRLLDPLNQFGAAGFFQDEGMDSGGGFLGPVLMGVVIGLAVFGVQRLVRRRREKHAPTKVGG